MAQLQLWFHKFFHKIGKKELVILVLFLIHIFFRLYGWEDRHMFGWDQVDNAWAAKDIIVDKKLPLVGMVAKQNSGFYIGPLYYYFIAPFYWLSNLDPVASPIIAIVTSVITFLVLFFCIKKIFSFNVAIVALFIHTVSFYIISADRTQWPINFIAPVSMLIFYCLYRILDGKEKYILFLAILLGMSFHLNFTAVFFPLIVLLCIPFFPKTKKTLKYCLIGVPFFLVWFIQNLIYELQHKASGTNHMTAYINTYYHGLHLTRIIQLVNDAFIEFEGILSTRFLKVIEFLVIPIFIILSLLNEPKKKTIIISYLFCIWILVPWLVFSIYKGEISNYYFSLTRPIFLMATSFIVVYLFTRSHWFVKVALVLCGIYYTFINMQLFFQPVFRSLNYHKKQVQETIQKGQVVEFQQGVPQSYIYYFYTYDKKNTESISK